MRKQQAFGPDDLVYIHSGKKLAVIKDWGVSWTNNVRKATVTTYEKAQAMMNGKGYEDLWYEAAHPFDAVIRLKSGEHCFYVEKQTRSGFWLVNVIRNAHHYKDVASAENALRKYQKEIEEHGYTAEVIVDESLHCPEKRI